MLSGTIQPAFGDAREDIVGTLAVVIGRGKAEQFFTGFEQLIEDKAKKGAIAGARPYIIAALALGTIGAVLGTVAFFRVRQRR